MYIILDGQVDFFVDVKKQDIRNKQVEDLCKDLSMNKNMLIKQILVFKDKAGLNLASDQVGSDIKREVAKCKVRKSSVTAAGRKASQELAGVPPSIRK